MFTQDRKVVVIIPAYNEQDSIGLVIKQVLQYHCTVLVIDDGSSDQTGSAAAKAGAEVISLPQNLGIGGAVQTGYLFAFRHGYDIAVQVDADGQHKPRELHKILQPLLDGEADLALGSRYIAKTSFKSSFSRRTGMILLSLLVTMLTGQRIYDTTSGFRAANRKVIELFAHEYSTDYPEVDALVLARKNGMRIKEVSVEMDQRCAGESSITPFRSAYYVTKVILALLVRSLRSV